MATTLINAIKEDHREIMRYYEEYTKNAGDSAAQKRWANLLTWEIARHSVGEEIVVYPLFEKHLGAEGKEMADKDRQDHQYVKQRLYELESLTAGKEEHTTVLKDTMDHLKTHIHSEENEDLPLLEKAIGVQKSKEVAQAFKRTKNFVPTRSHPGAPDKPPYETLAGFLQAPIDKLKDYLTTFPSQEEKEAAKESLN